jgi:hypothetical protein
MYTKGIVSWGGKGGEGGGEEGDIQTKNKVWTIIVDYIHLCIINE